MKRINCSITKPGSLKRAIQELENYKKSLEQKSEMFIQRLADVGINVAMMTLATKGQGDSPRDADFAVKINRNGDLVEGIITVSSSSILFWEFGSGIRFNGGKEHPQAGTFGMGPGTYPGQTHVPDPGYWYYYPEGSDKAVRSYGTEATMPMHSAMMEMIDQVHQIAKEVFSNG